MRRRHTMGFVFAAGMVLASVGFAHEVEGEHKDCDQTKTCMPQISCPMVDGQRVSYRTLCGASNCDPHSHDLTSCPKESSTEKTSAVTTSGAASTAGKVGNMPVPIKVTLEATIHQCVEPKIPESKCLRYCFPSLGEDACLEVVKPGPPPGEKK